MRRGCGRTWSTVPALLPAASPCPTPPSPPFEPRLNSVPGSSEGGISVHRSAISIRGGSGRLTAPDKVEIYSRTKWGAIPHTLAYSISFCALHTDWPSDLISLQCLVAPAPRFFFSLSPPWTDMQVLKRKKYILKGLEAPKHIHIHVYLCIKRESHCVLTTVGNKYARNDKLTVKRATLYCLYWLFLMPCIPCIFYFNVPSSNGMNIIIIKK